MCDLRNDDPGCLGGKARCTNVNVCVVWWRGRFSLMMWPLFEFQQQLQRCTLGETRWWDLIQQNSRDRYVGTVSRVEKTRQRHPSRASRHCAQVSTCT